MIPAMAAIGSESKTIVRLRIRVYFPVYCNAKTIQGTVEIPQQVKAMSDHSVMLSLVAPPIPASPTVAPATAPIPIVPVNTANARTPGSFQRR